MKNFYRHIRLNATHKPIILVMGTIACLALLIVGCAELETALKVIELGDGIKEKLDERKSFNTNPDEQEYYIGRAVGATIAGKYTVYDNPQANEYVNLVGQTLAQASKRPEIYGGYHFQILDSDEINAFAAPGGLIFVTRGILRCTRQEDALAAVLAHEIAHVQHKHGMQAIKKSRFTSMLVEIGFEVFDYFVDSDIGVIVGILEDSITDITTTMINAGYSRSFERGADKTAITIMKRVGYDANGLVDMLMIMAERLDPQGKDFAKTHPSPTDRIKDIRKIVGEYQDVTVSEARQSRFEAALGNI